MEVVARPASRTSRFCYPVLNEAYATKIASDWNVKASGVGCVTRFEVEKSFLDQYTGSTRSVVRPDLGYWIPEDLDENSTPSIVGLIEVVSEHRADVR